VLETEWSEPQRKAKWSIHLLAGGFRFDDEFPKWPHDDDVMEIDDSVHTFLGHLRVYPMSLVEEKPRRDFAEIWKGPTLWLRCGLDSRRIDVHPM
jgi:hypothetical protein